MKTSLSLLLLLPAAGCAYDTSGVDDGKKLDHELASRAFLDLAPTSTVGVSAYDSAGQPLPYVEPTVHDGQTVLRTTDDGYLLVEDLDIHLDDVVIPAGQLEPTPVVLTNVDLRLGTQLAVIPQWSADGMSAYGTGKADLLLDWSLVLDNGNLWPLATQKLGAQDFTVTVELAEDGTVTAQVDALAKGKVDQVNGLFSLDDLQVSVDAVRSAE
jgi:hypothetical protein